ncbi:MAG: hypothetical protein FJ207_08410 [Gemmatimonadetes bacterium]|nr:hypothetical protein [Gemmatimonadota bacterium]
MNAARMVGTGSLALALVGLAGGSLEAQLPPELREYPLGTLHKSGDLVAPFFDGWFDNGDGTVTYTFGFMNRNTEEIVDIPLGENNHIEPVQFDGRQPTHFPVYDRRGLVGKRERQVFGVTVPKDTEVVWTLTHAGRSYSVPGRATSTAYDMGSFTQTAANGSLHPGIRFTPEGPISFGPEGTTAPRVSARVGTPVTLSAMVQDRGERYGLSEQEFYPVNATWILHQGPVGARVQFGPETSQLDTEGWGQATTQATFPVPGEYVIRLRVDNFGAPDSRFDNQCCWSSAFLPVTVR